MVKIECTVWEQRQMYEYLDYSAKKLLEEYKNNEITRAYLEIEIDKIKNLRKVLNGKGKSDYLLRSSVYRKRYANEDELTKAEKELAKLPEVR